MEYSMYVCPECRKLFKVKGSGKKAKCTKCDGVFLLDLVVDAEIWPTYSKVQKDSIIDEMITGRTNKDIVTPEPKASSDEESNSSTDAKISGWGSYESFFGDDDEEDNSSPEKSDDVPDSSMDSKDTVDDSNDIGHKEDVTDNPISEDSQKSAGSFFGNANEVESSKAVQSVVEDKKTKASKKEKKTATNVKRTSLSPFTIIMIILCITCLKYTIMKVGAGELYKALEKTASKSIGEGSISGLSVASDNIPSENLSTENEFDENLSTKNEFDENQEVNMSDVTTEDGAPKQTITMNGMTFSFPEEFKWDGKQYVNDKKTLILSVQDGQGGYTDNQFNMMSDTLDQIMDVSAKPLFTECTRMSCDYTTVGGCAARNYCYKGSYNNYKTTAYFSIINLEDMGKLEIVIVACEEGDATKGKQIFDQMLDSVQVD